MTTLLYPFLTWTLVGLCLSLSCASNGTHRHSSFPIPSKRPPSPEVWRFGVMGDTQWSSKMSAEGNPGTVSVGIIEQINQQFIAHGVNFVVQVGDLQDDGHPDHLQLRADAAKTLVDAGIGFYPLRGNHEGSAACATQFVQVFPQTQNGPHQGCMKTLQPSEMGISAFTSPAHKQGLTYAFDCKTANSTARFVLLDTFQTPDARGQQGIEGAISDMASQLPWLENTLQAQAPSGCRHTFVFAHKGLILPRHQDTLFGAYPGQHLHHENRFMNAIRQSGGRYFFCGHDHIHQRSLIDSDRYKGDKALQQIVTASCSYKFYTPAPQSHDTVKNREKILAQDLYRVGYYLVTVKGPQVTVDYYASDPQVTAETGSYPKGAKTPTLHFTQRESFQYHL